VIASVGCHLIFSRGGGSQLRPPSLGTGTAGTKSREDVRIDYAQIARELEAVLDEIDDSELDATATQRAYIERAFQTMIQLRDASD
jgi:hypothetical protein